MRTLFLRVHRSSDSAMAIARHLHGHPALAAVLYPGLPSHPGHQIAARQMHGGFGGMLSIRLAGGAEQAMAVLGAVPGVQAGHLAGWGREPDRAPAQPGGPSSPVPEDLLRLSIGIEAPEDLLADLDTALAAAHPTMPAAPQHASG